MPSEECQQVLRTLHEGLAGELVDFTVPQNVGKMKNSRGIDGCCLMNNTSCGCLMICNRYVYKMVAVMDSTLFPALMESWSSHKTPARLALSFPSRRLQTRRPSDATEKRDEGESRGCAKDTKRYDEICKFKIN